MSKKASKTKIRRRKQLPTVIIVVGLILLVVIAITVTMQKNPPAAQPKDTSTPVNTPVNETDDEFSSAKEDTSIVKLYFPYDTGVTIALKEVTAELPLESSPNMLPQIAKLLKNPESTDGIILTPLLGPDANILNIERQDSDILKVNVSQEFIQQMNAGSQLEGAIIKGLVKTICGIYNAKGILLRVEGNLYESGHYFFQENEILYPED